MLQIIGKNERDVTVRGLGGKKLVKGQLVVFDDKYTGIVVEEGEIATVRMYEDAPVGKARVKQWWRPKGGELVQLVPSTFFRGGEGKGEMMVESDMPASRPGSIGWGLYWKPLNTTNRYINILAGSDIDNPSIVKAEVPGWWPEGYYRLKATRYYLFGYSIASGDVAEWYLSQPSPLLNQKNSVSHVKLNLS